jgi:hypothetical protein
MEMDECDYKCMELKKIKKKKMLKVLFFANSKVQKTQARKVGSIIFWNK